MSEHLCISPEQLDELVKASAGPLSRLQRLSPKRRQVFDLMCQGKDRHQISAELGFSIKTFCVHQCDIIGALGLSGSAELKDFIRSQGGTIAPRSPNKKALGAVWPKSTEAAQIPGRFSPARARNISIKLEQYRLNK